MFQQLFHFELAGKIAVLRESATLEFPFSVEDVVLAGAAPYLSDDVKSRALAAKVLNLV